jgi:hypothetical protein
VASKWQAITLIAVSLPACPSLASSDKDTFGSIQLTRARVPRDRPLVAVDHEHVERDEHPACRAHAVSKLLDLLGREVVEVEVDRRARPGRAPLRAPGTADALASRVEERPWHQLIGSLRLHHTA